VWELEGGQAEIPRAEVPDDGGATRSAKTIANPALLARLAGSAQPARSETLGEGDQQPLEASTPRKFQKPDQTTGDVRDCKRVSVIEPWPRRLAAVVESVNELEAERHQQGDSSNTKGRMDSLWHEGKIMQQAGSRRSRPR